VKPKISTAAIVAVLGAVWFAGAAVPVHAQGVTYDQLLHADSMPQNWLMYGGDYKSQRFSRLTQINRENVHTLKAAWIYQPNHLGEAPIESSAIVVGGIMYITEPPSTVTALDARLGTKIWSWTPRLPEKLFTIGVHRSNRGVAILGDRQVLRDLWLLLPRDVIALGVWAWSYASDTIAWRDERFLLKKGKLVRLDSKGALTTTTPASAKS